jgi:hypothetical protein
VKGFRKRWYLLREQAGLPRLRRHDFRRTTATNLTEAGVAQSTIKSIGGWKTDSVFRRYVISIKKDKLAALEAQEVLRAKSEAEVNRRNRASQERLCAAKVIYSSAGRFFGLSCTGKARERGNLSGLPTERRPLSK